MKLLSGDKIRIPFENYTFTVTEVWSDKECLVDGGRIIDISDIVSVNGVVVRSIGPIVGN